MPPTFRDVKGLKVNMWQFTANPPTKHGGIPAPKKTKMKFSQEKRYRVPKPKNELSNLWNLFDLLMLMLANTMF